MTRWIFCSQKIQNLETNGFKKIKSKTKISNIHVCLKFAAACRKINFFAS